jgi:uncharacterized protein YndB with AHSA1/START domain
MKSTDPELVFTRIVDAPREQVFEAWTDPAHLRKWLASERWTVSVPVADRRAGAPSLVVMQSRSGEVMTVTLTFEDSGGGTRYTARVRHWAVGEEEANETMGLELR